ncbi:retrovirus-related pol polyprotein from transposon TNT 1-94, partial [Tanacetum coccineum]
DDPNVCLNKAMDFLTPIASSSYKVNATSSGGNNVGGRGRVVKCYNCQGGGHRARQCTQPKRPRNAAWFKEKAILAKAQEAGQILDEEQLAFLANLGIPDDVILEVPDFEPYHTDMDNQAVQDTNLYGQQDLMILSVIEQMSEQMINHVNNWEKANQEKNNESLTAELERCLKKLKYHLGKFDTMMIKRITLDAITEGEWGFEHTKAVFLNEIIPFLKTLKDIFNVFDKDHLNKDVMLTVMNSIIVVGDFVNLEMQSSESCDKCSDLDAELLKKQNAYNELLKRSEDGLIRRIQGVGYGVLGVSWSRDHARIRRIFLMDTAYWSSE